jgi:O-antigen/teichoic acid export membrane protein
VIVLPSSEIRVRYSGFIIFASQIISLATGIVFTLLLTRTMNVATGEFGVWSFISYLTAFFILPCGVFPFWATRFIARGKEGATKTAVTANLIVAAISIVIYLIIVAPVLSAFGISSAYVFVYALASVQILNMSLYSVFEGCLQALKPQAKGYGLLIEEIVKVALAFVLIVGLKQLFVGAMISMIAATAVQVAFYAWVLRDELKQAIRWSYLREWVKGSTAYIYNVFGTQLGNLILYVLLYYSGQAALGDYQAAVTFSVVISYASSLAFALYPKMLAQYRPEDVAASFKTVLMFALPMSAVALTMARSLLIILNASYDVATPILMLLTINTLIVIIAQFYTQCLMGMEAFDIEGKISIKQLAGSKIFKVFTVPYIQAAIVLPSLYLVLSRVGSVDPVLAVVYMVIISIASNVITYSGLYVFMRRSLRIQVAWKSIGKYVFGAVVAALVLLVLPQTTTLAATFGKMLIGVAVYAALLYAIDADARKLTQAIWDEIRGTFR